MVHELCILEADVEVSTVQVISTKPIGLFPTLFWIIADNKVCRKQKKKHMFCCFVIISTNKNILHNWLA